MISYYEQLLAHKYDNIDKVDQILKRYKLPEFTQVEIDKLSMPPPTNWIKN